jgi:Holliday junction resolvase
MGEALYRKGREKEYEAKAVMESRYGCYVIRSAGSHSPVDLLCGNGIDVFAVQVKAESSQDSVNWQKLRVVAQYFQAIPTLLVYHRGGRWTIYLDGERVTYESSGTTQTQTD